MKGKCPKCRVEGKVKDGRLYVDGNQYHRPLSAACLQRQLAQRDEAAERFERVCDGCGGVVSGKDDFPCPNCGEVKGKLLCVAFLEQRERVKELEGVVEGLHTDIKWCVEKAWSDEEGVYILDVAERLQTMYESTKPAAAAGKERLNGTPLRCDAVTLGDTAVSRPGDCYPKAAGRRDPLREAHDRHCKGAAAAQADASGDAKEKVT